MNVSFAVVIAGITIATLGAQTPSPRVIRAVGNASVSVRPDQAKVNIGVVTQAATAQEAAQQNAAQVTAVLAALAKVLGPNAETKTVGYSITPVYRYAQGQPPQLTGYSVTNTIEVTTADMANVGRILDAASQSGANNIGALRFGVKDDQPPKAQALALAARQARAHAEAIASGLSARVGTTLSAEEGAVHIIAPLADNRLTATQTPIEPGLVQIQATVTVTVELLP